MRPGHVRSMRDGLTETSADDRENISTGVRHVYEGMVFKKAEIQEKGGKCCAGSMQLRNNVNVYVKEAKESRRSIKVYMTWSKL